MSLFRARAADDFATIRARLDELRRREPEQQEDTRPTHHAASHCAGSSLAQARSRLMGNFGAG
jgi:hypothetical protein